MDVALTPPTHIQPVSGAQITAKDAQKRIERFLADYQARSLSAQGSGGDTALTVQLQKLSAALKEDSKK
ncbi:hypothetical protein HGRIS_005326 [Hohenbuehelia grisea]|uniref:Uncharacterized protein n=1 Tax=Hohenbuehelia grisea TaxID=104357 RepID=A0ABR3JEN3_9AGAR